jgi:hypothetical protein
MAETRFRDFYVKKQDFGGFSARNRGLKHNYVHKIMSRISGGITREIKGLNYKDRTSL